MSNNVYQIKAALSTCLPLSGIGDEAIIDIVTGEVIARFYNGNFVTSTIINSNSSPTGLTDETITIQCEAA